jgi:MFS family permease
VPDAAVAGSAPLRHQTFRALWLASVASNVGTWMHDTSAGWLMVSLAPSPVMVALMQTAATAPFFLLALPGGALADILDRRRLLLATQAWMLLAAAALGVLTLLGRITPGTLLLLTFVLGVGNAMNAPVWQAIVPELVPRAELPAAVTLGSLSFNVARAVGPTLGGLLFAAVGPGTVFLLNAASFLAVILVVAEWRREAPAATLPAEEVVGAIRAGARYARHAAPLRAVLARCALFVPAASALWALLPLVGRQALGLGAVGYGTLLGCLGGGAIVAAWLLPRGAGRVTSDRLLGGGALVFALVTVLLGILRAPVAVGAVLLVGGAAWTACMSTLTVAAQTAVPGWVRARALAIGMLTVQGGLAAGSLVWGTLAAHLGMPAAFACAAAALVLGVVAGRRWPIEGLAKLDLTPTLHWAAPVVVGEVDRDEGPVLVTIEYTIDPARADDFLRAVHAMHPLRRRDGAIRWGVYRDAEDPRRYVETFVAPSWIEHLRHHERVTVADREIEAVTRAFQVDGTPVRVRHHLWSEPHEGR